MDHKYDALAVWISGHTVAVSARVPVSACVPVSGLLCGQMGPLSPTAKNTVDPPLLISTCEATSHICRNMVLMLIGCTWCTVLVEVFHCSQSARYT